MNESEQAQTIAELKEIANIRNGGKYPSGAYIPALRKAVEIVDSQAQKIAEQAKEIERLKQRIAELHAHIDEAQAVK